MCVTAIVLSKRFYCVLFSFARLPPSPKATGPVAPTQAPGLARPRTPLEIPHGPGLPDLFLADLHATSSVVQRLGPRGECGLPPRSRVFEWPEREGLGVGSLKVVRKREGFIEKKKIVSAGFTRKTPTTHPHI